ncbi:torsin-1A-interacting protein 2-like isoform X2 [Pagrus major]|uniref:torsin-1A-interacting protein 2-like isoform X2 n=1 Tax=Pagrus major TaxID=143350 RepID=UPI003CC88A3D
MAEQTPHVDTADVKPEERQSANEDHVSPCDEHTQGETEDGDSAEEKTVPPIDGSSSPDEPSTQTLEKTVVDRSPPPQADDGSQGDNNGVTERNEPQTITGESHTGDNKATKTTTQSTLHDCKGDQADGPNDRLNEEATGTNNTDDEAGEDDGSCQENTTSPQTDLPQDEEEKDEQKNKIQTIGPTTVGTEPGSFNRLDDGSGLDIQENTTSRRTALPQDNKEENEQENNIQSPGGNSRFLVALGIMVLAFAILVQLLRQSESPPQKDDVRQIDIFLRQMEKVKTQFPNQRAEVWNRSKIHLLRHLQTAQPTEPVSLILTAGVRAERTLHCLAKGLASAFSSALNASVLHIDGASKASQDSDQVKLDIDSKLQGAFEGDKPVAVIHRFEELPPGSTLIFYRYCDHENAAYKKTFLIFTVLLGEEEEIPAKSRLSTVEEMVDDHLQKKFISDGQPVSFDRMDLDKYGGLWSRISHLILPVTAEKRMEHEGC